MSFQRPASKGASIATMAWRPRRGMLTGRPGGTSTCEPRPPQCRRTQLHHVPSYIQPQQVLPCPALLPFFPNAPACGPVSRAQLTRASAGCASC
jgi:hypothetical protein